MSQRTDRVQAEHLKQKRNDRSRRCPRAVSLIGHIFGMSLSQSVRCKSCGDKSARSRSEYCFCVTCPTEHRGAIDVTELLATYTQEEHINEWKCDKCSQVGCVRQAGIHHPPNVLLVHVSRLQRGICPRVTFQKELTIQCDESAPASVQKVRYLLFAVIVYRSMGSNGGHYFAFVRSGRGQSEQWFLADDDDIKGVAWTDVQQEEPFMLLYEAAKVVPPLMTDSEQRLLKEEQLQEEARMKSLEQHRMKSEAEARAREEHHLRIKQQEAFHLYHQRHQAEVEKMRQSIFSWGFGSPGKDEVTKKLGYDDPYTPPATELSSTTAGTMAAAAISLDDFKSLTARQLRQECTSRGVSLTGCFDKDAMLQRLQKALSQAGEVAPTNWQVDTNANIEESEVCGKGAAATQGLAINFSKLSDRSALEVIPMRALMKECKLLGIDVSGLYAKCEVIKKMVSEMNRIVVAGKEASFFVAHSPRTVDEGGKKPPIDVQAEFFLPEPLGPPVALRQPQLVHESRIEEIILEASPKAAPKEPREMSQPRVSTSASEGIGAVGTAQRRASISELFRLPLPELQIRCEAEGITVAAGDAKGLLISKLKQAMTRSVAPATAKESNDWTKAAKLEPPVAAPEAPDKVEPLEGPQVFHMASDDESLSAEHSDADFFPDFPAPPPAEEAGHIAETGPTSGDAAHVSPGAGESKSASESMDQAQASSEAEAFERTGFSSSIETDAVPVAPAEKTQAQGAESQSKQAPDAAEPQQAAAEPSSAATETTTTSTTADQALDDADAKDLDEGDMSSERDGGMFDFDDLDEAEVGSQLPTSGGLPMPSPDEPAGPVEKSPGLAEPVSQSQSVAPNENQSRSDKDPDASSEGSKNPLLKFTTKELLELARSRGVDVRGCVEKSDIVDRLTRAPRVPPSPAQQSRPAQQGVPPKPPMQGTPRRLGFQEGTGRRRELEGDEKGWFVSIMIKSFQASKPPPSAPAPKPAAKRPAKVARRPPANVMPDPGNQSAPPLRHPGEIPDGWSARVQTWFGRYPGFSAMLPPEAEMWTDQELDVYFGSNGDIWPRGKRPAWIGRPSTEPDPKPSARAPGPKTYPDLKVHFQTLDLAETTPPEIIRRHYRRLARDCHPDKHPDNVEEATRRFQQLTEAYEAELTGSSHRLTCVSHLRHRLQQSSNVPLYDQHLICGNKVLTDDMSLGSLTTLGQSEFLQITLLRAPKPCALTAGSEGNFMLWDLDTGHCCRFLPFSTSVLCLKVDWLARIALSGHTDSCLRLWDLDRGFCLREMPLTNSFVSLRSVDFDWQMKVAVSSSLAYGCPDLTPRTRCTGPRCTETVGSMIGSPVQPLGLWDLAAGGYIRGFLTESMHAACISADWSRCQLLAAGDALELFDIDLGQRLWCLRSWQWRLARKPMLSRRYLWRRLVQLDVGPSGALITSTPSRCVSLNVSRSACLYAYQCPEDEDEMGESLIVFDLVEGREVAEAMHEALWTDPTDWPSKWAIKYSYNQKDNAVQIAQRHQELNQRTKNAQHLPFPVGGSAWKAMEARKKKGQCTAPVLVCFEGLGRGIHFDGVDAVYILGLPQRPKAYLHYAGRVGRLGQKAGKVVSILPMGGEKVLRAWESKIGPGVRFEEEPVQRIRSKQVFKKSSYSLPLETQRSLQRHREELKEAEKEPLLLPEPVDPFKLPGMEEDEEPEPEPVQIPEKMREAMRNRGSRSDQTVKRIAQEMQRATSRWPGPRKVSRYVPRLERWKQEKAEKAKAKAKSK
eukprot:g6242.t2